LASSKLRSHLENKYSNNQNKTLQFFQQQH